MPTRAVPNITPFQALTGEIPDLAYLRVFGCRAYVLILKEKRLQSAKWDRRSERCILVGYDRSGISCLWNGHRVIRSKDVILDEKPANLLRAGLLTPPRIISASLIVPTDSQVLEPKSQPKISQNSSDTIQFPEIPMLESLNEALENNGGDRLDHSHSLLQRSQADMDSPLSLLPSTLEPAPNTSSREFRPQIPTKPPGFQHTAWVTMAYLAGYDAGVPDPPSYLEAMQRCNAAEWKLECDDKFHSLDENNTWKLVPRPRTQAVLGGKWVFKTKRDALGQIVKYKICWVVHGFGQVYGIDFDQTYASVVKSNSYKVLLVLATQMGWPVDHMDFVTAFLNGAIDGHDIFVEQPLAYEVGINLVCKLLKALYGLKQSPQIWYQVLHDFLHTQGFTRTEADHSIFVSLSKHLIIEVYVDDLLIAGENQKEINQLKKALTNRFKMTDLGPVTHYLGLRIIRDVTAGTMFFFSRDLYSENSGTLWYAKFKGS